MGPDEEFVPHTNMDEDMEDVEDVAPDEVPSALDRSAEDIVQATLAKLLDYTHIADKYVPPDRSWTCEEDLKDAARMRQHMEDHNKTSVCACCSRRREACEVHPEFLSMIPNLHLLSADHDDHGCGPTPELPRDALMVFHDCFGKKYCLQVSSRTIRTMINTRETIIVLIILIHKTL